MEVSILQALLIGVVASLTCIEGDFLGECKLREPLVTGFLVGLILGEPVKGVIIGGQLQLIWMGATGIGLSAQLDIGCGGTIGTAFAIMTNSGVEVAVALGLPVSILMQSLNVMKMTALSGLMHQADKYALEGNMKAMARLHWSGFLIDLVEYTIPTFICIYFGAGVVETIVGGLPAWLMKGLGAVSVLLPAMGFAMLLQILITPKLIPFFIFGFVLAAYTGLDMLAITLIAVSIALVMYQILSNQQKAVSVEEDEEDL